MDSTKPSRRSAALRRRPLRIRSRTSKPRVLQINLGRIRYGTDDKTHAAAVVFSLLLFFGIITVAFGAMITGELEWANGLIHWLGAAFLMVVGVAIGGGSPTPQRPRSTD